MIHSVSKKTVAIITGGVGVLVIALGFVIAPLISCTGISVGFGPELFKCPGGIYGYSDTYPYFDMLFPWLFGGVLILFWTAYRYTSRGGD